MGYNPPRRQRVGNLRHRVTLQELVLVEEDWNPVEEWQDRGTVPARVEPLKGSEQWAGDTVIARQAFRVFIRYRAGLNVASWRIVWLTGDVVDSEPFNVTLNLAAISNPDERRRFLELLCEVPPGG